MHKVSIITPTSDREEYLKLQYQTVKKQEEPWEWLICDSSFCPSPYFSKLKDKRVLYIYDEDNLSIGAKRNILINKAQGDSICHFDDDDYYVPHYLKRIRLELEKADFFKLIDFFCYALVAKSLFYWDSEVLNKPRYEFHPTSTYKIRELENPKLDEITRKNGKLGYGFSYAYKRDILDKNAFDDISYAEDAIFAKNLAQKKVKMTLLSDKEGLAIAMIHDRKTASTLPQFRIPDFIAKKYFPDAAIFFKKYPKLLF